MVLTPNDLFSWNNKYSKYTIILSQLYTLVTDSLFIFQLCTSTYSVHAGILKLLRGRLPCPLVVFSFHYGSCLPSSFVRSQLTLPVPTMRIRPPFPQNGVPIHRVRTHSLSRVRDSIEAGDINLVNLELNQVFP
jgi:hypothetical protein